MKVRLSGVVMGEIEGSELYYDPAKYNGGTAAAVEAHTAIRGAIKRRQGRGWTYLIDVSREAAAVIIEYCSTVGGTLAMFSTDPADRSAGRALLRAARKIETQLNEDEERREDNAAEHLEALGDE